MKKFIETEMGKIKGKDIEAEQESEGTKYLSPEDAALQVFITDSKFYFILLTSLILFPPPLNNLSFCLKKLLGIT